MAPGSVQTDSARIMVVDDDVIIAEDLVIRLKNLGYHVSDPVTTGEEAVVKAALQRPDLVLMDIVLAGRMDGIEAAEQIRAQCGSPVIFVTSHADDERLARAKKILPCAYVLKPFHERELKAAIEMGLHVSKVEAHRRIAEKNLENSNRGMADLLASISDGFFSLDHRLVFTYFNRAAETLLARKAEEVLGKPLEEAFPEMAGSIFEKKFTQVLQDKTPLQFETFFGIPPYKNWYEIRLSPNENGISVFFLVTTERKKNEAALKENEKKYRTLVETAYEGLCVIDLEHRILFASHRMGELLGCSASSLWGRRLTDFFCPEDLADFHIHMNRQRMGEREVYEQMLKPKTGVPLWTIVSSTPVFDDSGSYESSFLLFTDISDRKRTEKALTREREQLLLVFDGINAVMSIIDPETLTILFLNRHGQNLFGSDAIGKKCHQAFHALDDPCSHCLRETLPAGSDQWQEWECHHEKLQRDFMLSSHTILWPDGRPVWLTFSVDITERKKMEDNLRAARRRFMDIIEFLPDATFVVNEHHNIVAWNRAMEELTGVSQEEVLGQEQGAFATALYGQRQPILIDFLGLPEKAEQAGYSSVIQKDHILCAEAFVAKLCQGQGGHVWAAAAPLFDQEGRQVGAIESIRDITLQKQAEEEKNRMEALLRQAQKMEALGTLAGGIAHDFNNILAAIIGYTELATFDLPEKSPVRKNLGHVLTASQRAKNLIRQILSFSRQTDHERRPVDLKKVLEEIHKLLQATIPATIRIEMTAEPGLGNVLADTTQIHQMIMNLCTNAAHAMENPGGTLTLKLERVDISPEEIRRSLDLKPGAYQRLTVSDTGPGMPPDVLDRIFEPFFTTKAPGQGTGMGLSVVHGIVKGHDGAIIVQSSPEEGSSFYVFLPIFHGESPPMNIEPDPDLATGSGSVLFVDDEPHLADFGEQFLQRLGYSVTSLTNSLEAWRLIEKEPERFDLVITDQTMPYLTGLELARKISKIRPGLPVILCTGYSRQVTEISATNAGIKKFLLKPLVLSEVAAMIKEVMEAAQPLAESGNTWKTKPGIPPRSIKGKKHG